MFFFEVNSARHLLLLSVALCLNLTVSLTPTEHYYRALRFPILIFVFSLFPCFPVCIYCINYALFYFILLCMCFVIYYLDFMGFFFSPVIFEIFFLTKPKKTK